MNYSKNPNPMRKSEHRNDYQFYQSRNAGAMPTEWFNTNTPAMMNTRRNIPVYNSAQFIPNQQYQNIIDPVHLLSGAVNRIPLNLGHTFYRENSNTQYGGNISNSGQYNRPDYIPFVSPVQNNEQPSWAIPSNNSQYNAPNALIHGYVEPEPDPIILETNFEVSVSDDCEEDSNDEQCDQNIASGLNEVSQNNDRNQGNIKQNNQISLKPNTSAQGMKWSDRLMNPTTSLPGNNLFNQTNMGNDIRSKQKVQSGQVKHVQSKIPNSNYIDQMNACSLEPETPDQPPKWSDLVDPSTDKVFNLSLHCSNFSQSATTSGSNKNPSIDPDIIKDIIRSVVASAPQKKRLSETLRNINPKTLSIGNGIRDRFFIIKSYSEDDLHRAIKYGAWCSTDRNNIILNNAYNELNQRDPNQGIGRLFLFFSINGSGFFSGIAEMISIVDPRYPCGFWHQERWKGRLYIKWHYVKDVPNNALRHIRSDKNDKKPATNSKDGTEVTPRERGKEFIKVFHQYKHLTSLFDDFVHYEEMQPHPDRFLTFPIPT